ncbi:MAG: WcaF family extracellular polysaccharide biosynthesis acetyltransferase [Cyanobacteria bacterium J06607_13]
MPNPVRLDQYSPGPTYSPGAPLLQQLLWYYVGSPLCMSYLLPFSGLKVWLLRRFGATVGSGVRIKPGVRVKFPWRLSIADHAWLGEGAWIDNLAPVAIASHVCISQGTYLCTGNHDWRRPTFDLRVGAISIEEGAWLGARSVVGPGVTVGAGAVLSLNSVASRSLESWMIYVGNPAQPVKKREILIDG